MCKTLRSFRANKNFVGFCIKTQKTIKIKKIIKTNIPTRAEFLYFDVLFLKTRAFLLL